MSYRDTSNQSADISENTVKLELIRKGWIVLEPSSRDCVYDFVVDMGDSFQTIQVKTLRSNKITKIVNRSHECVSRSGKTRNSLDYAEYGVDWLVGVNREGVCYFYKLKTYSQIPSKSFSVNKYPPDNFPSSSVPQRHSKKTFNKGS